MKEKPHIRLEYTEYSKDKLYCLYLNKRSVYPIAIGRDLKAIAEAPIFKRRK